MPYPPPLLQQTANSGLSATETSYHQIATAIASGHSETADTFQHNLFCYWEALLVSLGFTHFTGYVLASVLPGVLLVMAVYALTRRLFGSYAALLAAYLLVVDRPGDPLVAPIGVWDLSVPRLRSRRRVGTAFDPPRPAQAVGQ